MGKSLYRSYRSKTFDEIIGQDHIITVLKNALKSDSINHAYLLSGPRGVGKTSTARVLAHAVNDIEYEGENLNLDIIEIDAASNRRIDEVREIRDKVNIAPVSGKYKVYIIDEVHMLTKEAFNALLKTLEEPPSHAIFILATTEKHKVPDTILSRCVKLNFKPVAANEIVKHLKNIAKKEKISIDDAAIELLAEHAKGSFRDAISLLEQVKFVKDKITADEVSLMLGMATKTLLEGIIQSIQSSDINLMTKQLDLSIDGGVNESVLASQLSELLRKNLMSGDQTFDKSIALNLLKDLLLVPGSSNPRIQLELSLTDAILRNPKLPEVKAVKIEKPSTSSKVVEETIVDEAKTTVETSNITNNPEIKFEESKPKIDRSSQTKTEAKVPESNLANNELWDEFLALLKKSNNTLYGISRMATVDVTDSEINMGFKFAFHYKQVTEAKNQKIFKDILTQLGKSSLNIKCHVIEKDDVPKPKKPTDENLKAISNIFGGHEVLES